MRPTVRPPAGPNDPLTFCPPPQRAQIGAVSTPTANVAQRLEHAPENQKLDILVALISSEVAAEAAGGPPMPLTIVFVERKTRCDEVAAALREEGIMANALHGGLNQVGLRRGEKGHVLARVWWRRARRHQTRCTGTVRVAAGALCRGLTHPAGPGSLTGVGVGVWT